MSTLKAISILLGMFCVSFVAAQSSADFDFFSPSIKATTPSKSVVTSSIQKDKNELQQSGFLLYQIYRNLISTQDGSPCRFYPTCSAYCRSAVIKNGLIKGLVQGIDRMTRCNGLTPQKYAIDIKRRKLVDHVH